METRIPFPPGCAYDLVLKNTKTAILNKNFKAINEGEVSIGEVEDYGCSAILQAHSNPYHEIDTMEAYDCFNCPLGKIKGQPGYREVEVTKLDNNIYKNQLADIRWKHD